MQLRVIVVLLLMFGLALGSVTGNSPTFDEQGFVVRGLAYLRGEHRQIRVGHPLGLNALNASLLVGDQTVQLPTADPSWQGTSFHRPAELFLWEIGNDVAHVMFLARLPTVWLGLILAAVCGRWAWEMTRRQWAGWLALTLVALDPNVLAHTSLATTDLGLTAGAAGAGFTLWRFLRRPGWSRAIVAGAAFGLLQNTKFTALLFVSLFGLVILFWLVRAYRRRRSAPVSPLQSPLAPLVVAYPLTALLTLWAGYGFDVATMPGNLPTLALLSGRTLPLAHYLEQLLDLGGRLQFSTPAFLLGRYSDHGWWYYFPVAFLVKTPLPTLALLTSAAVRYPTSGKVSALDLATLLVPALGYFGVAMTSDINLGYRHLLPMLPFLFVFIAGVLAPPAASLFAQHAPLANARAARIITVLLAWLALSTLTIFPHFLSYFNPLAGGPSNGWRFLVDSNLDWGQDLGRLPRWMAENGVDKVWLSYFGEARPDYYGIAYNGLDSFPPRLMNPQARPFYPHDPAPGVYAISATNLQGVHFQNHDLFAWFRRREPDAKIGYSIFVYEVPARGEPAALALSGVHLDEIAPADFALLGANQVVPRWFDAAQSLLTPDPRAEEQEAIWLALGDSVGLNPHLQSAFDPLFMPVSRGSHYRLYTFRPEARRTPVPFTGEHETIFQQDGGAVRLSGITWLTPDGRPSGRDLVVVTTWQQLAEPKPLKIFIHAVGPDDQIAAQWDGLGAAWEGWLRGDYLIQVHQLNLPADAPVGSHQMWLGLYDSETLARWHYSTAEGANMDRYPMGSHLVP